MAVYMIFKYGKRFRCAPSFNYLQPYEHSMVNGQSLVGANPKGVFSTGAMGALASAMLKNKLLAPAIFEHFSTVGKNCGC